MPPLTMILLCLAPGSEAGAPPTDFAINLRLASTTTHAPLSPNWAMSYYQQPPLVGTPAPIDSPTRLPVEDLPVDVMPIDAEPFAGDDPELALWHDWTMSDLSLEWGLATIGPGVLSPQGGSVGGRPGGGGGGGGGGPQPNSPGFIFIPPTPNPIQPPGPGPGVEPVPEPSAIAMWLVLLCGTAAVVRRRNASLRLA